jgi:nucleotide-binding universal stress UspA family protein
MTGAERPTTPGPVPYGLPAALAETSIPLILVPLDGSREAKDALPVARLVAGIVHGTIHVVHVLDRPVPPDELLRRVGLRPEETRGLVVDQVVGRAADAVVSVAREAHARVIVMTTRGKTAYHGRTVRPVVEEVIRRAPCPVLLVRPEIDQKVASMTGFHRILLPLDGAPSSAAVIGPALDLAELSGAEVDVLYVATRGPRPTEPGSLTAPLYIDQPQYEWPTWAQEFVRRFGTCLGARPLATPTRLFLRRGEPADEIVALAVERQSDLIVLEWRGRLDPAHARVVKGVLTRAPCPVLLIQTGRGPGRQ